MPKPRMGPPTLAIAIGTGKGKASPPDPEEPMEQPAGEAIPPEAVCFRTAAETCGGCVHFDGGNCAKLQMPVAEGDGCNLFSPGQRTTEPSEQPDVQPAE